MKRFTILFAVALVIAAMVATPAYAKRHRHLGLRVSVKQTGAHKVAFKIKTSRTAKSVRIVVYRGRHAVKHLRAHKSSRSRVMYYATWSGDSVQKGKFHWRVLGYARHVSRGTKRGKIKVWRPKYHPPPGDSDRWIGLWVPGSPQSMAPLQAAESVTGVHAKVVHFYIADSESFPQPRCEAVDSHGSIPLVTWEFWSIGSTGLSAITNGSKDAYITQFAEDAKAYGKEVWVRPFHEMNGNWYPWGGTVGSNSASKLISAWKHVRNIFVAKGATNVKFVWSPNIDSVPNTSANSISAYWPGDTYVDSVALDGYNHGTTQSWSSWRSFESVFCSAYSTVAGLSSKPIFVAETGSVEQGGSKATWISQMFSAIPNRFPRLVGVCWFDENKTYDWRINSSSSAACAFRTAAAGF